MKQFKIQSFLLVLFTFLLFGFVVLDDRDNQLTVIASEYQTYSRNVDARIVVTDSSKYEWTIALCGYYGEKTMGYHHEVDSTFFSNADSIVSPHGNKLYKLFVKNKSSYEFLSAAQPIGQTIVKETWNVKLISEDSLSLYDNAVLSKNDNHWYVPTTVSQLFIMYKETPSESNDDGWVYGIVDVESSASPKVLSKGNISSCISCHKNTKYDRLFGRK